MTIDAEIKELDKYWNELIYTVTKGSATEMREIVKFSVFDFMAYVENYMKGLKK